MKLYNALIKKNKEGQIEDIMLLKDGFSWMAFFFSIFWFLYHKMWKESAALLVVNIIFILLDATGLVPGFNNALLEVIFAFLIALNANYWRVDDLKKKNYEFIGLVFGIDEADAKMRFINNLKVDCHLESMEFNIAISNPKLHRQLKKLKEREQYFAI